MPKIMPKSKMKTEQVVVRMPPEMARMLDKMVKSGGHAGRAPCAYQIIRDVLDDDAKAHDEPGLPREH